MALAYGYETAPRDDPIVRTAMLLVNILSTALSPERGAILSAFPFRMSYHFDFCSLRSPRPPVEKLPSWFPGTVLWRDAAYARRLAVQVLDVPFNWVKDQMV